MVQSILAIPLRDLFDWSSSHSLETYPGSVSPKNQSYICRMIDREAYLIEWKKGLQTPRDHKEADTIFGQRYKKITGTKASTGKSLGMRLIGPSEQSEPTNNTSQVFNAKAKAAGLEIVPEGTAANLVTSDNQ